MSRTVVSKSSFHMISILTRVDGFLGADEVLAGLEFFAAIFTFSFSFLMGNFFVSAIFRLRGISLACTLRT